MPPLSPADVLPLTCTREGVCCHGHRIWINPWELAVLAAHAGESLAEARARLTDCRGLRLAFDGPPDRRGLAACRLYDPAAGCTRHAARPLTCRVYPLGRLRVAGEVQYVPARGRLPCLDSCPTVTALPAMTVADYLAGQQIGPGEIAHDAYANLVYGLMASAAVLYHHPHAGVERAKVLETFDFLASLEPMARIEVLPAAWSELLTDGTVGLNLADPGAFVQAHGERLKKAILGGAKETDAKLTEVTCLYVMMALHLVPVVGGDPVVMRGMLVGAS